MNRENKCVLIQTKVTAEVSNRLEKICEEYHFSSKYEIIQYLVTAFLKYADPDNEPSESDALPIELAKLFECLENKIDMINSTSPTTSKKLVLSEAINIYSIRGINGSIAEKYTMCSNGDFMKTQNNSRILRTVLCKLFPRLYKGIKNISVSLGNISVDDTLSYLVDNADTSLNKDSVCKEIDNSFNTMKEADKHVDISGIVPKQTRSKSIDQM